jgi:diaminohydroxyphosphoribosylaminopyrimidine deaminase/5-amino-6-(5-phosphoribosylamino)uracil reductase
VSACPGGGPPCACLFATAPTEDAVDSRYSPEDDAFMAEALGLAGRVPRRPWPNPPVGAIVVKDGRTVGRGAHLGAGTPHAEIVALREAGALARGATLYCTLEPCNHEGRTPPCAPRVAASGIARAVIGVADPNRHVCGGGVSVMRGAGIEVSMGLRGDEALDLIWPFAATGAFERPFVVLKTATSLDGRFAPPGEAASPAPRYLTGPESRRDVHRLRRWCDVVLVGERTMAMDRPRLDGRLADASDPCPAADPVPAWADTDLSFDGGWPGREHWAFAGTGARTEARRPAVEARGGRVVICAVEGGRVKPASIVAEFGRLGGHVLLVEGGPTLAWAFLEAGVVDRWVSYTAPTLLGSGVGWPPAAARAGHLPAFTLTRVERCGGDVKAVFDRACVGDVLTGLVQADRGRIGRSGE